MHKWLYNQNNHSYLIIINLYIQYNHKTDLTGSFNIILYRLLYILKIYPVANIGGLGGHPVGQNLL